MENPFHVYFYSICEWKFLKDYFIPSRLRCLKFPEVHRPWNVGNFNSDSFGWSLCLPQTDCQKTKVFHKPWKQIACFRISQRSPLTLKEGRRLLLTSLRMCPNYSWCRQLKDNCKINCTSHFVHCHRDKIPVRKHLRKEGFHLGYNLQAHRLFWQRRHGDWGWLVILHPCSKAKWRELVLSRLSPLYGVQNPQCMEWCHPHLGWGFSHQLMQSRKWLIHIPRGLFLNPFSNPIKSMININLHTKCSHPL